MCVLVFTTTFFLKCLNVKKNRARYYSGADKSLAQQGRKEANVSVRIA